MKLHKHPQFGHKLLLPPFSLLHSNHEKKWKKSLKNPNGFNVRAIFVADTRTRRRGVAFSFAAINSSSCWSSPNFTARLRLGIPINWSNCPRATDSWPTVSRSQPRCEQKWWWRKIELPPSRGPYFTRIYIYSIIANESGFRTTWFFYFVSVRSVYQSIAIKKESALILPILPRLSLHS